MEVCKFFSGLNKDFKMMLIENAEFKALSLKEIRTASDGTKKVDIIIFICMLLLDSTFVFSLNYGWLLAFLEDILIDCETHRRFADFIRIG